MSSGASLKGEGGGGWWSGLLLQIHGFPVIDSFLTNGDSMLFIYYGDAVTLNYHW